jgi:hypothetical protein
VLLGSVSQNCAHHATCPLVIIRAAKDHHSARLPDPAGAEGTT